MVEISEGVHVKYQPRNKRGMRDAIVREVTPAYLCVVGANGFATIEPTQVRKAYVPGTKH